MEKELGFTFKFATQTTIKALNTIIVFNPVSSFHFVGGTCICKTKVEGYHQCFFIPLPDSVWLGWGHMQIFG